MGEIKNEISQTKHSFCLSERNYMDVFGVSEVVSFDASNVTLITSGGEMSIDGEGLKVGVLDIDSGKVSLSGKINAVYYFDDPVSSHSHGFFGKLFK